jgi:hypothetical protein
MRVCFSLTTGSRCCINEHGSTVVDDQAGCLLDEAEFAKIGEFEVSSAASDYTRILTPEQLQELLQKVPATRKRSAPTVKRASLLQSVQ